MISFNQSSRIDRIFHTSIKPLSYYLSLSMQKQNINADAFRMHCDLSNIVNFNGFFIKFHEHLLFITGASEPYC